MHVIRAAREHLVLIADHAQGPMAASVQVIRVSGHVIGNAQRANAIRIDKERAFAAIIGDFSRGLIAELEKVGTKIGRSRVGGLNAWYRKQEKDKKDDGSKGREELI
jgi:hypothetical protein